jgi:two-component system nitrate/nitrite sensor histidine kinase NarX
MRTLLVELRPGSLTELPLGDLLRQLAEAAAGRTRLEVTTSIQGTPRRLPPPVQMALYRIAQEALNNSVKHAGARQAMLSLDYASDGGVRLHLADDGRGFDPDPRAVPAGHLGLSIMRERADAIGAQFQLQSQPGGGTAIEVSWHQTEEDVTHIEC